MPELRWDELDFLTVLEVEPDIEEDGISYFYSVEKDELRLEVCVFPYDGEISILLYREGIVEPFLRFPLAGCREARRVFDKRGEFLEIVHAHSFGSYDHYNPSDGFDVRLWIKPSIKIELI